MLAGFTKKQQGNLILRQTHNKVSFVELGTPSLPRKAKRKTTSSLLFCWGGGVPPKLTTSHPYDVSLCFYLEVYIYIYMVPPPPGTYLFDEFTGICSVFYPLLGFGESNEKKHFQGRSGSFRLD